MRAVIVDEPADVGHAVRIGFAADHQHRRPLRHLVVSGAAETFDHGRALPCGRATTACR